MLTPRNPVFERAVLIRGNGKYGKDNFTLLYIHEIRVTKPDDL